MTTPSYGFVGAVIVNGDLGETKSLEKALEGADIMFLTTHYWEDRNKEKEVIKVCSSLKDTTEAVQPIKNTIEAIQPKKIP
jgi:uncharacterized protein YbjT (DUF2867 family)